MAVRLPDEIEFIACYHLQVVKLDQEAIILDPLDAYHD